MASPGAASALRRLASAFLARCSDAAPDAEVLDYLAQVLEDGDVDVAALVRTGSRSRRVGASHHRSAPVWRSGAFRCSHNAFWLVVALLARRTQADIVAGFVPAFGALPEAQREEAVVGLLDEALCAKLAEQASCAADPPQTQPAAPPPPAAPQAEQQVRRAARGAVATRGQRTQQR